MNAPRPSFFAELQRRHVYKVGAMYCVAGWLLVQIVTQVLPVFDVSALGQRILVLIVMAGFPLALVLAWLFDITPQGIVRTGEPPASGETPATARERRSMDRRLNYVLGFLLLLALGYVAAERMGWVGGRRAPDIATNDKSIAVLPFENLSDDKANAWFAEGMQDEILTRLAAVGELKVISRTSTEKYKSHPDNLKSVAADLGVASVLEGSVQRSGDKIRVNVQLIDARADAHLWASIYDRDVQDVFAVESEVSQAIVDALKAKLSPGENQALAAVPTRNSQAYDLFLKGEYALNQAVAAQNDAVLFDQASDYYRQAIALDPQFALAHAQLAYSQLRSHWFVRPLPPAVLEQVKATIDRALELQPDLAEAHESLGLYHYWIFHDYTAAMAEFERALALKPNDANTHVQLAAVYRRTGQWDQALAEHERSTVLAPRDGDLAAELGTTYVLLRRYDEAERVLNHALALSPDSMQARRFLATTIVNSRGDVERARHVFDPVPPSRMVPTARVWGDVGLIDQRIYLAVLQRRFGDAIAAWNQAEQATSDQRLRRLLGLVSVRLIAGQRAEAQPDCTVLQQYLQANAGQLEDMQVALAQAWLGLCQGHDEEAVRAAQRAVDLRPIDRDTFNGPYYVALLAQVEAQTGRMDPAIAHIEQLLTIPAGGVMSIQRLKLDPVWDPLRQDPRFQKLVADAGK
jgi:TolB-like protein/Flp pilus assembly protein TadD